MLVIAPAPTVRPPSRMAKRWPTSSAIGLPEGAEMIMPGDNVEMTVELITPIALEVGQRFAIREGGRTVGAGAVTTIAQ